MVCREGLRDQNPHLNMEAREMERWVYESTQRQLERMRSMQYAYHRKFFSWIVLIFGLLVLLLVFGGRSSFLWIPFIVVTAGVQAAFYLHFCDFARIHAAALEEKINGLLGKRVHMGAELESAYFYPLPAPKVAGFIPSDPLSFFSFYTLHWSILWTAGFFGSLWAGWNEGPWAGREVWAALAVGWALFNGGYVAWYFLSGNSTRRMAAQLEERLHGPLE
jgi:hypothetical protein